MGGVMRLPNGHRATGILEKLVAYSLNVDDELGRHKARTFESALGVTLDDAPRLAVAIAAAAATAEAIDQGPTPFGHRYRMDFRMTTAIGTAWIRTGWIVRTGEDFPRLTTCYIPRQRRLET